MTTVQPNHIDRWLLGAVSTFNASGDLDPYFELLAEDCLLELVTRASLKSRSEITNVFTMQRDQLGWNGCQVVNVAECGPFIATVMRNTFRDGTSWLGSWTFRFNAEGKIDRIVGLAEM